MLVMEEVPGLRSPEPNMEAEASNPRMWDVGMGVEGRHGKQSSLALWQMYMIPTLELA